MKKFLVLFALLGICGCNYHARLEKDYIGKNKSYLTALKGTPDKVLSDGFGGEIYSYITYWSSPEPYGWHHRPYYGWPYGHSNYGYGFGYSHTITRTGKTSFWIDPFDKIYKVSTSP